MSLDIKQLHLLASEDSMALKRHSILRMHQRQISVDEIKEALLSGRLIENYPDDRPLPSGLILGTTGSGRIIHAVIAIDTVAPMLWVITVYEPTRDDWEDGFERRRTL